MAETKVVLIQDSSAR